MSQQVTPLTLSFKAGDDLSSHQYKLVKLDENGNVVLADADAVCVGILHNKPKAGDIAAVATVEGTTSKVIAGGAIAIGSAIVSNASGKAVARTTEENIVGYALEAASDDGDVIEILLRFQKIKQESQSQSGGE